MKAGTIQKDGSAFSLNYNKLYNQGGRGRHSKIAYTKTCEAVVTRKVASMIEIPYTVKKLSSCVGYKDIFVDRSLAQAEARRDVARQALKLIEAGSIFHNPLRPISIRQKQAYTFNSLPAELASRLITKNIKANYHVRQADRQTIISNLITILNEGTPFHIYRYDIKDFYESIDRKLLFQKLLDDAQCSWQTMTLLSALFDNFEFHNVAGLPRGLGISSSLSEFYVQQFDEHVKGLTDVFLYSRFVDDILIITSGDVAKSVLEASFEENLPSGLYFHKGGKRAHEAIPKVQPNVTGKAPKQFEYLGYEFKVFADYAENLGTGRKRRKVEIDISESKKNKIKSRLLSSLFSYISGVRGPTDYLLLKNRIRALTGNYTIRDPSTGIKIRTGIYFNYVHKNMISACVLSELDQFYKKLLFSSSFKLSQRIAASLPLIKRRELARYGFVKGFTDVRYHSFDYKTLKKIKECWRK